MTPQGLRRALGWTLAVIANLTLPIVVPVAIMLAVLPDRSQCRGSVNTNIGLFGDFCALAAGTFIGGWLVTLLVLRIKLLRWITAPLLAVALVLSLGWIYEAKRSGNYYGCDPTSQTQP